MRTGMKLPHLKQPGPGVCSSESVAELGKKLSAFQQNQFARLIPILMRYFH